MPSAIVHATMWPVFGIVITPRVAPIEAPVTRPDLVPGCCGAAYAASALSCSTSFVTTLLASPNRIAHFGS